MSIARTRYFRPLAALFFSLALIASGCSTGGGGAVSEVEAAQAGKKGAGDASVSAADGGPGFTGKDWKPTSEQPLEGSEKAVKGGAVRYYVGAFPATLRPLGKDSNTVTNSLISNLCYQRLLSIHSDTLEYVPQLASHWQISEDKMTFRFRINPQAKWSDGKPVVAQDVIASFDLHMDSKILEPAVQILFGKFERPKALSKYIVEVKANDLHWRNFMVFSTNLIIFPAHQIEGVPGNKFLETFQFKMPVGSGPYTLQDSDIKKGESVTLRRRPDFWGWSDRNNTGLFNFDLIRLVADAEGNMALAYEQAKKGQIDIFEVYKAQDWVEAIPKLPQVKDGHLLQRRIYNDDPMGVQGIAINMRKPPLDDIRVRRALSYLQNRKVLIDKLFFNEYTYLDSYYSGTQYANPDNEKIRFNPELAQQLLSEAGWTDRDSDGVLKKDGKRMEFELLYSSAQLERVLTVFQESCLKAGVKINLKLTNGPTLFQTVISERKFELSSMAWTGSVFPEPEVEWSSKLADVNDNNNITGFKDKRVDEIIKEYGKMFEQSERNVALQEVDGLLFKKYPYILAWGLDNTRLIYWNKFGQPDWYLGRTSRGDAVLSLWWYDKEKDAALKKARADGGKLDPGQVEVNYWREKKPAAK
jgi:microcin C transport system substrate-binding protein